MDPTRIDAVARIFARGMTRREALRGLVAGAAAITAGGTLVHVEDASAGDAGASNNDNVCDGKNWCRDRTGTCGQAGGIRQVPGGQFGSAHLRRAPLPGQVLRGVWTSQLHQLPLCAGGSGGDRCNNGPDGYEFVCVRKV